MLSKKIVCLAVDDEPLALSILKKYIGSVDSLELVGSCENAVQALQLLQKYPVDLIFLDIQMPQIMGTDFIRTLKKLQKSFLPPRSENMPLKVLNWMQSTIY